MTRGDEWMEKVGDIRRAMIVEIAREVRAGRITRADLSDLLLALETLPQEEACKEMRDV